MYGGQTTVPYGCPNLLAWGRRLIVNQQDAEKKLVFYGWKSVEMPYLPQPPLGRFSKTGYQFDRLVTPDSIPSGGHF